MPTCARCGEKQGFTGFLTAEWGAENFHCGKCADELMAERAAEKKKAREAETQRVERLMTASKRIVVTTTPGIDGYRVRKYLGIESIEFVIGTGVFSEVSSSVSDFFGARSTAFESKLQTAKQQAMDALKFRAAEKGANAVVGVDLDYTEFSGNRVALIINGTLVSVEPINGRGPE